MCPADAAGVGGGVEHPAEAAGRWGGGIRGVSADTAVGIEVEGSAVAAVIWGFVSADASLALWAAARSQSFCRRPGPFRLLG